MEAGRWEEGLQFRRCTCTGRLSQPYWTVLLAQSLHKPYLASATCDSHSACHLGKPKRALTVPIRSHLEGQHLLSTGRRVGSPTLFCSSVLWDPFLGRCNTLPPVVHQGQTKYIPLKSSGAPGRWGGASSREADDPHSCTDGVPFSYLSTFSGSWNFLRPQAL